MDDEIPSSGLKFDDFIELLETRLHMTLALRVAVTMAGIPRQCRNKNCRITGRCHLVTRPEDDAPCQAHITPDIIDRAAGMFIYMAHFVRVFIMRQEWTPYTNDGRFGPSGKPRRRKKRAAAPADTSGEVPRLGQT